MKQPVVIGLTGSIGMGKSTVAQMFAARGCSVWSADDAVHELYQAGMPGHRAISELVPEAALEQSEVDRALLSQRIKTDTELLSQIEALIHPLVQQSRSRFVADSNSSIVVLEIPLLFETGFQPDIIVVVSADAQIQADRVLARPGMTPERLADILKRQVPDAEKRQRADYVIDTSTSLEATKNQVQAVITEIEAGSYA